MRLLVLDAALGACSAGVVVDGLVCAQATRPAAQGQAGQLAAMAASVLAEAGDRLDAVAVTVGPGSFTGLRAALALAHGIALGAGIPVIGVSVGEALAAALTLPPGWPLWSVIDNRRGRVFLERDGRVTAVGLDDLPPPPGQVALAGDAAAVVAARLAARGHPVMLTDARLPAAEAIARAAAARQANRLPPRDALPLYVDPPSVRLPDAGLRPPPVLRSPLR
ncbi:MAG: tRNA (adenosine(37)-N6)-threonylcarbamoyltransferase complex dimerization subunit type 1 TsaB [Rhodospirillales bacterium]|nr:tRNA (adenosine(37)-N6)-threonylcarbamoyltransferase complex dimerization subunit type 1 TsaB [Rhodospirillales bacterium]